MMIRVISQPYALQNGSLSKRVRWQAACRLHDGNNLDSKSLDVFHHFGLLLS